MHNGKPLVRVVDGLADLDTTQPATPEQRSFGVGAILKNTHRLSAALAG
ncbi:hypothetical protein P2B11_17425 [Xanthomonas perforans]